MEERDESFVVGLILLRFNGEILTEKDQENQLKINKINSMSASLNEIETKF